ncbi:diacylglycerol kinase [Candidatus Wolfebacteria bacterium]|nr:diacylglycerol kinase [Candidatus Wolfebacteria bacterium]
MFTKFWKSVLDATNGIATVWREERNFRVEVVVMALVVLAMLVFKFSLLESALLVVAIGMVLAGEILNTALEDLCNKVEPEYDAIVGKIKDTVAAFVLVSSLSALIIGVLVFVHHFVVVL